MTTSRGRWASFFEPEVLQDCGSESVAWTDDGFVGEGFLEESCREAKDNMNLTIKALEKLDLDHAHA